MAVLGRVLFSSAERVDLPDLAAIDSYAAGDWRYFLQSVVGTTRPYILSGFDIINPSAAIGSTSCAIRVADSVVYYPSSSAGPFFYGLPEGDTSSEPLVPQLRANTTNYVYLTLSTFETAPDTRAIWDPDRNNGTGAEFTQDLNTESVIQAQVHVSTGAFPADTIPVAIIKMGPNSILSIQDARDMLFRLGTGGLNPNPLNSFSPSSLPSASYSRFEPATTMTSAGDPNPFQGGDKNVKTLKEWMDLVMTKLKELGGNRYWYEDTSTYGLVSLFNDAVGTSWKTKGTYTHSTSTPGKLEWSEDIYLKNVSSPREIVIRSNTGNALSVGNEQVAFIELVRNQPVNSLDMPVSFVNGQAYINVIGGSVGFFANLKKGDWIKKATDDDTLYLQVREFWSTTQSSGTPVGTNVAPEEARSITLSGSYQGTTSLVTGDQARFDRGEYTVSDIQVVDRNNSVLKTTGGNLLWFALRSDTVLDISSISSTAVTGTITTATVSSATVSAVAHGLVTGDRITVTTPAAQAGTWVVTVLDADSFTIATGNATTGTFTGYYGLATTSSTSVDGFQLESANHNLESGETVSITSTGFTGSYIVSVRSATQFQFPIGSNPASQISGTVAIARMKVRSEEGVFKEIQGESSLPATTTARGAVVLNQPPVNESSPKVAIIDSSERVVAEGITRGSYASGPVSVGVGANDSSVTISKSGATTTVVGSLVVDEALDVVQDLTAEANLSVGGTATVDGNTQMNLNLTVEGVTTLNDDIYIAGLIDTTASIPINLGTVNATAINVSHSGQTTTINGALSVAQAISASSTVSTGGNITIPANSDYKYAAAVNRSKMIWIDQFRDSSTGAQVAIAYNGVNNVISKANPLDSYFTYNIATSASAFGVFAQISLPANAIITGVEINTEISGNGSATVDWSHNDAGYADYKTRLMVYDSNLTQAITQLSYTPSTPSAQGWINVNTPCAVTVPTNGIVMLEIGAKTSGMLSGTGWVRIHAVRINYTQTEVKPAA